MVRVTPLLLILVKIFAILCNYFLSTLLVIYIRWIKRLQFVLHRFNNISKFIRIVYPIIVYFFQNCRKQQKCLRIIFFSGFFCNALYDRLCNWCNCICNFLYINPIIGDMKVQDVTPRVVDKYIQTLQKTPAVNTRTHHAKTDLVTNATIEKIIKLLRCAFKQAVRWELIAKNPFDNVVLPKTEYKKRDIWTADMIRTALDQCTDSKLYVAMNLSFACSLRMGEILGLTWNNVHISDDDIADDNAYVFIDKELARASKRAIEMLGQKDVYHIFTPLFPNTSTRVILKKPKTDSSIRKVWLPKTLAYILREWKKAQDELRGFLGDEYQDYDLVVALPNGRPCEDRIILKEFEKLREKAGLPRVVFHSLRHSSTTYKLKLNHGDLKATQGDTGHAEIDMITSVYAHILDEDRKINAQKFESAFYAKPDLRAVRPPEEPKEPAPATLDLEALVEQLWQSPELANTLAALLSAAPGGR